MKIKKKKVDFFDPSKIVYDPQIFKARSESEEFSDGGIFSPKIFGDIDAVQEYSCSCGNLNGKFFQGAICPKCGTEVIFKQQSIDRFGFIDCSFAKYDENGVVIETNPLAFHLIKYIDFYFISKIIGSDNIKSIIFKKNNITISGEVDNTEIEEIRNSSPKCKYYFIGLLEFYEKYDKIIKYYFELNKGSQEIFDLISDRDSVFTDKIPVVSPILRPAMRTADGLKLDEINILYQNILKTMSQMKKSSIQICNENLLEIVQAYYFQISEKIIDEIKSKDGLIRDKICGTRINFSARNIISAGDVDGGMESIAVPYLTFLELYKFEIISILVKIDNISYKQAEDIVENGKLEFNKKLHRIMQKIVNDNEIGCLLNRNPTINVGSILYVRIARVKDDFSDLTLGVSNLVLSMMNGDYDGDVLNLISLKDKSTRELFKSIFSPINFIINPADGKLNNSLNLERDQILGLNSLI